MAADVSDVHVQVDSEDVDTDASELRDVHTTTDVSIDSVDWLHAQKVTQDMATDVSD